MLLALSSESVIETAVFTSDQKLATLPWSGATSSIQRMRKTWKLPSSRRQISAFHDPLGDFASSSSVHIRGFSCSACARARTKVRRGGWRATRRLILRCLVSHTYEMDGTAGSATDRASPQGRAKKTESNIARVSDRLACALLTSSHMPNHAFS